ncbi:hemicentin-2 isoform X1 [Diachasmimorpha longicaudata]|uniref:hemicentin-2 isoform X1 n=1 Tax=Diachasmimorpha longicaudata TaxID=58733 RepID=UPI0030B8D972
MDTIRMDRIMRYLWISAAVWSLCALSQVQAAEETQVDTHEGSTVLLQCRFPPVRQNATSFWLSNTNNVHDNAVVDAKSLSPNYRVDMDLAAGRYDLEIHNVSYDANNGKYECRIKKTGSGVNLYHKNVTLTVLRVPGQPSISPTSTPATEGKSLKLQCNTYGGSPEPEVKWYKDNSPKELHTGRELEIVPTKDDDGAIFWCVVRNRAMPVGHSLNATVRLDVNYFPRVTVGPENPLKVAANGKAVLRCNVDSKPKVNMVRWMRDGSFFATSFDHTIPRVTIQDAGHYTCQADNALGRTGEASLYLDVLYPPTVAIEGDTIRVAEVEDTVTVHCNVSANPQPTAVEWFRDGKPEFRHTGPILRFTRVNAEHAGNYTCKAINIIHPSGGERKNHSAIARVNIRIRHKPGPAKVTPDSPVAVEHSSVILTCMASPAGYPEPQYKWFKEGEDGAPEQPIDASGAQFVIDSVTLASDGTYRCLAMNEIGTGEAASVRLTVHQQPKIVSKLQPHLTRTVGESGFTVSCMAHGKPKPLVRWLKDEEELTADESLYKVVTLTSKGHGNVITVNSTLSFLGHSRPRTDEIIASDRGKYTCVFVNEVKKVESEMMLKIAHAPIVLHKHSKVAYNLKETAEITCKVQAWPKPEFQWSFASNTAPLQGASSDGHYELWTTTVEKDDIYTSVLRISDIEDEDYGEYSCRAANAQGPVTSVITLQPKGAPERPSDLSAVEIGPTYVALQWEVGFDGGVAITKYFVSYRRVLVESEDRSVPLDCAPPRGPAGQWQELDCRRSNPCNITGLEQHQKYTFKVKAYNTKNHSDYSEEKTFTTTVAKIPSPHRVSYHPESGSLVINVGPTCLAVVASIERTDGGSNQWRVVDEWPLEVMGSAPTQREGILDDPDTSSGEPRLKVKLCLKSDREKCGDWTEAEVGPSVINQAGALATPTLIALVVSGAVFLLFTALLLLFCRCRRKHAAKAKDYEMDSNAVRPSLVTGNGQQNQAPPPYFAENKALEHSLDHALAMEDSKTPPYAQTGYGYHQPTHNINGENGVNMGYLDNSYSNSNNGGSVNSQDSIWQMKSAAANGVNPQYDLGGYAPTESDYPTHQHYLPQREDYRESHNLSRQQFCTEPFATVVKTQKHVDSQYDVSGLPYQETYDGEPKPPQVSLSYDESLESGYSTPNSRRPRIIREIIV